MRGFPRLSFSISTFAAAAALQGCGESTLRTESALKLETSPLELRLALEGPVEIMMQGPSTSYEGTYISEEQFDWIDEDKTSAEWVRAAFGPPDFETDLSDGSQVWRWTFRPTRSEGELFKVFGGSDEPEPSHITALVQIRNGVVVAKRRG